MTKTHPKTPDRWVPRLASRHYRMAGRARHITLLIRPAGHQWRPERDFHVYPRPLTALASRWLHPEQTAHGVTVVLAGRARLWRGGKARDLAAGDRVVFNGEAQAAIRYEEAPDFLEASLAFDAETAESLRDLGLWPEDVPCRVDPHLAAQRLEQLGHAIEIRRLSHAAILRRAVGLLGLLEPTEEGGVDAATEDFATRACALLRRRHGPADRIAGIAEELGISPGYFRRVFLQAVGLSPTAFQLRERMTRAAALLRTHDVQSTAAALGYSDPFVFSRQFKAQVGIAPRDYRHRLLDTEKPAPEGARV